jgi:hypothetical protein
MARTKAPDAPLGPGSFLQALKDPARNLKQKFLNNPLGLAERFGLSLPKKPTVIMRELGLWNDDLQERWGDEVPGLRDLVEDVCLLNVKRAVAIASRGGGKSQGVSYIEFFLWMVRDFDCINLGGSEQQANNVYQYLLAYLETDPFWNTLVDGETMISESKTIEKAWIKVLTASQKQTRAPHAGGKKVGRSGSRGGLLVIDEEAEAEPDIVRSALPTVNTATPSVHVRCSTFHKIGGTFQEVVDDHAEMGYKLYKWDTFDVCAGCECTGGPTECQSDEPCFREDHFEEYIDPDTNLMEKRLIHKAYCGGRAKYAKGWVLMDEIKSLWRSLRRNHSHWEVEAMGSRPSSSGFVVKSISDFNDNITDESAASLYVPGNPVTVTIDYGTVACAICVWQMQRTNRGQRHVLLHADELHETGQTEIFETALGYTRRYRDDLAELAGDIGGGGAYFNPKFENEHRLPVRGVNFNQDKEAAVSVFNIQNENSDVVIPTEHADFIRQVRKWKRNTSGHIIKGDDHLCDSGIVCYFSKFIDSMELGHLRVSARGFDKAPNAKEQTSPTVADKMKERSHLRHKPMARSFGSGKGRR